MNQIDSRELNRMAHIILCLNIKRSRLVTLIKDQLENFNINSEICLIFTMCIFYLFGMGLCYGNHPLNLRLDDKLLKVCPESPNCVLSQSTDPRHKILPLSFSGSLELAKKKLNNVINLMGNSKFVTFKKLYWHIEFTTRWLGFVDDVEFHFVESQSLIHVRSASRVGYWDFGVNRKRVEAIRLQFGELKN